VQRNCDVVIGGGLGRGDDGRKGRDLDGMVLVSRRTFPANL
jgi:hypothetical protein